MDALLLKDAEIIKTMDTKTMMEYALLQAKAWEALAKSLQSPSPAPEPQPVKKRVYKKKEQEGKKRDPSAYNLFVRDEIARIRQHTPDVNHKTAMALAVAAWKERTPKTTLEETLSA